MNLSGRPRQLCRRISTTTPCNLQPLARVVLLEYHWTTYTGMSQNLFRSQKWILVRKPPRLQQRWPYAYGAIYSHRRGLRRLIHNPPIYYLSVQEGTTAEMVPARVAVPLQDRCIHRTAPEDWTELVDGKETA